ncbi:HEAT repeat domain-containing protein [Streptomyces sp. NPDC093094]|uniref:HEAT repeat domain-containing protein n=1 Tax=Streptomyces sp. NPDC093094 TaxID=3366026 RepID=UPI003826FC2B
MASSGEPSDPEAALTELRARLQTALVAKRLTKSALTRRAMLGRTSVSRAFSASAPVPSAQTVSSIAAALGLDPDPLLRLRAVAVSGTAREAPGLSPRRFGESRPDVDSGVRADHQAAERHGGPAPDEEAMAAYALRVRQTYAHLELDVLTPLSDQSDHPPVAVREVFVVPGLRADPPPVELPRELVHRLLESGDLAAETEPPEQSTSSADEPAETGLPDFFAEIQEAIEQLKDSYRRTPVVDALTVLASEGGRRTVLLGDPGAGKSTLARYLALTLTHGAPPEGPLAALAGHVPLLVELREYAAGEWRQRTFEDFITHLHINRGMAPPPSVTLQLLRSGRAVVVFDGLDELFDPRIRQDTQHRIAAFAARYPSARVIVTSRTIGYQRAVLDGADFSHHMLQDLDGSQISDFAHRWYTLSCRHDPQLADRLAGQLVAAVTASRPVREIAGNPLLLTILAIIGRRKVLPRDRRGVYEHAVTVLVAHWDQQAKHLQAELAESVASTLDALGERERTLLLQLLARAMQEGTGGIAGNHIHGSDLERLIGDHLRARYEIPPPLAATCSRAVVAQLRERNFILSRYGGEVYGFVHRAFLEYLAAIDIIQRIKDDWERTPKQYVEEIVTAHAADPAWHEVLLLLIGELGERAAAAAVDRILVLHAQQQDPMEAGHVVLALRALAEVGAVGGLSGQSAAVVDAVCALLDTSTDAALPWIPAAASAFQMFGPYWTGRERYLRWYHLRGQFSEAGTEAAELAVALRPDPAELRRLAAGSFYGPDREIFLKALAEGWSSQRATQEFLADRSARDHSPGVRLKALELLTTWPGDPELLMERLYVESDAAMRCELVALLIDRWPQSRKVREALQQRATSDPHAEVRRRVVDGLLRWPDRADVRDLLVAVATDTTDPVDASAAGPALTAAEALAADLSWDESLEPVLAQLAEHPSPLVRRTALPPLLDRRSDDEARRLLCARAENDEEPQLRWAAVRTLTRWPKDDGVLRLLRARATEDASPVVRWTALKAWVSHCEDREEVRTVLAARMVAEESPDLRWGVLAALVNHQADRARARLLLARRAADDTDPEVRAAALRSFVEDQPHDDEVWSQWVEVVNREVDPMVRFAAVSSLEDACLEREDVRTVLVGMAVGDPVPAVRWGAASALGRSGQASDLREVLLALGRGDTEPDVRLSAVARLSDDWAHDEEVASFIAMRARQDPDPLVRRKVLEAWTGAGISRDPTPTLVAMAADDTDPTVRFAALTRLTDHHTDNQQVRAFLAVRVRQDPDTEVRRALLNAWTGVLPPTDPATVLLAVAADDTDPALRLAALTHLTDHHADNQQVRAFLVDRIREHVDHDVTRTVLRIWDGDGPVADEEVPALVTIATDDPAGSNRWTATAALVRGLPDEERLRVLLADRAAHDEDPRVRWAATLALVSTLPVEQAGRVLAERATQDEDRDVRSAALNKLIRKSSAGDDRRELLLKVASDDEHPTMRSMALALLAVHRPADPDLRAALTQRAEHDSDSNVRWTTLKALATLWGDDDVRALFAACAAQDPDADLRWAASVVMANRWPNHSTAAMERLQDQALSAPDAESRWLALAALSDLPGTTGQEALLADRAKEDPDPLIRQAAFDVSIRAVPPEGPLAAYGRSVQERLRALQSLLHAADDARSVAQHSATFDPNPAIRRRVLAMIALEWPDRRTAMLLADRAAEDEDPEVRPYAAALLDTLRGS